MLEKVRQGACMLEQKVREHVGKSRMGREHAGWSRDAREHARMLKKRRLLEQKVKHVGYSIYAMRSMLLHRKD